MSEEKLTMDDFSAELEASFKKIEEGDMLTGTVISVDEKEVILDLKYYAEGVIRAEDFSNEPGFSLKDAVQVGDEITATVIRKDDGHGNILLSRAEANDILAWEKLAQYKEEKTVLDVKVKGIVNAGVIAYVEGIRGFIPASKLSLNYVEDLNEYLNKDIQVQVFDLDKEKDRLILSAREILREKADEERKEKISNVEVGLVTEGNVESLQPYGAFISLGNGLSGLVHISQICAKRIKQRSQCRRYFFRLWKFDCFLLNFFGCDIVEGFHGKTEFAVFDGNDFYFDFVAAEEIQEETIELPKTEEVTTT